MGSGLNHWVFDEGFVGAAERVTLKDSQTQREQPCWTCSCTNVVSSSFICVSSCVSASCQAQVTAFLEDEVLLPCVYRDQVPLPESVSIFWRDKDDKIVLDIINSSPYLKTQDQVFKNRVQSFPEQYNRRNFSIILTNVRQSDGGIYECHIPKVDFQTKVQLKVEGLYVSHRKWESLETCW